MSHEFAEVAMRANVSPDRLDVAMKGDDQDSFGSPNGLHLAPGGYAMASTGESRWVASLLVVPKDASIDPATLAERYFQTTTCQEWQCIWIELPRDSGSPETTFSVLYKDRSVKVTVLPLEDGGASSDWGPLR